MDESGYSFRVNPRALGFLITIIQGYEMMMIMTDETRADHR